MVETDRLAIYLTGTINRLVFTIHALDHVVTKDIADLALPQIGVVVFIAAKVLFYEVYGFLLLIDDTQVDAM